MSDLDTTARPYARAIFELASEQDRLQSWQDSLLLAASIAADDAMHGLLHQPALVASDIAEMFREVMKAAGAEANPDFGNLISLLAENGRLAALPAIAVQFETLKQEAEGKIEVKVRSAQELTAEQQQRIADSMAKRLGKKVSISTEIDENLIAGAIVTAGDLVIDGSASGRMEKLTVALNK
jgi:F-type H+-transporting ATPase subunit delta